MALALIYAVLSSFCFGFALVTARIGFRMIDARAGAAISIPTATVLFLLVSPFAFDTTGFTWRMGLIFAAIGVVFPAVVTLLTFRSNELIGPTMTSSVSATAPLFALVAAAVMLGERVPAHAALSVMGVVVGITLLSWKRGVAKGGFNPWSLSWPVAGAVLRGVSQVVVKAALLAWPSAFSACLIGYVMSSATVIGADRLRGGARPANSSRAIAWFAGVGVLNGSAVLLMYAALNAAPVWKVAPIIASYPLVTAVISAAVLHDEKISLQMAAGACLTVAAIVYLFVAPAL